jgi:hypothetical protein
VYQKPIVIALIVLGLLSFAILMKRFKLEAFSDEKELLKNDKGDLSF